ncbi:12658_t:CDS:2, partial [Cetraspora pellucida]
DKDKTDRLPQHHIYACTKVNAYHQKSDNMVYITNVCNQHNHALVENISMIAPSYHQLTLEMHDDVRLLVTCKVCSDAIIEILQHKYPGKYIHPCDVYNLVQTIRYQKGVTSDASSIYLKLLKQKQDSLIFHVDACFKGKDNHLVGLCWMNPNQQKLEAWALCFIHWAFNASVQSIQQVESYNAIIKNNVNRSTSFLKLECTIEKLLVKKSYFIQLNKTISKLPVS